MFFLKCPNTKVLKENSLDEKKKICNNILERNNNVGFSSQECEVHGSLLN